MQDGGEELQGSGWFERELHRSFIGAHDGIVTKKEVCVREKERREGLSSFAAKGERRVEAQTSSSPPTLSIHSPPSFFIISTLQMKPRHAIRPSSPLPFLPPEMKQHILRFCDPSTLAKASRVSLAFLELSSPILYQEIELIGLGKLEKLFCPKSRQPFFVSSLVRERVWQGRSLERELITSPPSFFVLYRSLSPSSRRKKTTTSSFAPIYPYPTPEISPSSQLQTSKKNNSYFQPIDFLPSFPPSSSTSSPFVPSELIHYTTRSNRTTGSLFSPCSTLRRFASRASRTPASLRSTSPPLLGPVCASSTSRM